MLRRQTMNISRPAPSAMGVTRCNNSFAYSRDHNQAENKSVKHLAELHIEKLPSKYILPPAERPKEKDMCGYEEHLPLIDLSELQGPQRAHVVEAIGRACAEQGFFQVVNHGISTSIVNNMMEVASQFFDLPLEEKRKYMSMDMNTPVRYGTSYNQFNDRVLCWRDFLKHYCHPLDKMIHLWPSNPPHYRRVVASYSEEVRLLAINLMRAILESLGLTSKYVENAFKDGSQVMVLNCYPPCPQPDLTLGLSPHSDYGCITVLLQDDVGGLQVQHEGQWKTVRPLPNSFVINVGDHLEVLSNGRCKSVIHRAMVNSERSRVSVATLHTLPFEVEISPAPELIDEDHPKMYRDTNFSEFMKLLTSTDMREMSFLDSIKLVTNQEN
eukprot:Gb_08224 [translate_table: standard]